MEHLVDEVVSALDGWADECVAVRVVTAGDELVSVFAGTLRARSADHNPPFFWALDAAGPDTVERQGIYVHPELVSDVRVHPGDFVVEYVQADVTVNVRLLGSGPRRAA